MSSAGPRDANTIVNDASAGVIAWTNPDKSQTSNDDRATATLDDQTSQYIKLTNFGFSIPADATIDGIVIETEVSKATASGTITMSRTRIVKGDVIGATNNPNTTAWTTTDTYLTHGSSSYLWGETWTAADINGAGFGCAIMAINSVAASVSVRVDHVRITVYYTESTGGHYFATQVI